MWTALPRTRSLRSYRPKKSLESRKRSRAGEKRRVQAKRIVCRRKKIVCRRKKTHADEKRSRADEKRSHADEKKRVHALFLLSRFTIRRPAELDVVPFTRRRTSQPSSSRGPTSHSQKFRPPAEYRGTVRSVAALRHATRDRQETSWTVAGASSAATAAQRLRSRSHSSSKHLRFRGAWLFHCGSRPGDPAPAVARQSWLATMPLDHQLAATYLDAAHGEPFPARCYGHELFLHLRRTCIRRMHRRRNDRRHRHGANGLAQVSCQINETTSRVVRYSCLASSSAVADENEVRRTRTLRAAQIAGRTALHDRRTCNISCDPHSVLRCGESRCLLFDE